MSDRIITNILVYPENSEQVTLRQIGFGLKPLILIEPGVTDDGEFELNITSSLVAEDAKEVAGWLTEVAEYATETAEHGEHNTQEE